MSTNNSIPPLTPEQREAALFYRREFKIARVVELIEVVVSEGVGTKERPMEERTLYFDKDGKLLAKGISESDCFIF